VKFNPVAVHPPLEVIPSLIVLNDEVRQRFKAGEERHRTCRIDEHFRTLCAID